MYKLALIFSIISFLAIPHLNFSQKGKEKAYIVTLENDTVKGFVDFHDSRKNPKNFKFQKTLQSDTEVFEPGDIRQLTVANNQYFSATVELEVSSLKNGDLSYSPELDIITEEVFVQAVYLDEKSLFYYKDIDGKNHFFIQVENELQTLVYKKYYKETPEGINIFENKMFIGQLKVYFQDFPELFASVEKTKYTSNSMYKLFKEYYKLAGMRPRYSKQMEKLSSTFGLLAGVSSTGLIITGSAAFSSVTDKEYSNSTDFTGGISFDLILPRNKGRFSINNELIYTSYLCKNQNTFYYNDEYYISKDTEIGFDYIRLNNMAKYRFLNKSIKLFVTAGISNGFAVSETNYQKTYTYTYGNEKTTEGTALESVRNHEQGYLFGLGVNYRNLSTEARYEGTNGFSAYSRLKTSIKRIYLIVNYTF